VLALVVVVGVDRGRLVVTWQWCATSLVLALVVVVGVGGVRGVRGVSNHLEPKNECKVLVS
jgi:hypothetical protein